MCLRSLTPKWWRGRRQMRFIQLPKAGASFLFLSPFQVLTPSPTTTFATWKHTLQHFNLSHLFQISKIIKPRVDLSRGGHLLQFTTSTLQVQQHHPRISTCDYTPPSTLMRDQAFPSMLKTILEDEG